MSVHSILYSASRQRGQRVPLTSTLMQLCQTESFVIESQIYLANLFEVLEVHMIPVKLYLLTMDMYVLHLLRNILMQMHP
jgi:hypothetical protein